MQIIVDAPRKPVGSQSNIVMTCMIDKRAHDIRRNNDPQLCYAPVGSKPAHDVMPHQVVIGKCFRGIQFMPGQTDTCVTSCVNGLTRDEIENWRVVGVSATRSDLSTGARSDDHLTVVIGGTASVINSGCEVIQAGDIVYIDPNPYVIRSGPGGDILPAIVVRGTATDKFLPQTRPLKYKGVGEYFLAIQRKIDSVVSIALAHNTGRLGNLYTAPNAGLFDDIFRELGLPTGQAARVGEHVAPDLLWMACKTHLRLLDNAKTLATQHTEAFVRQFLPVWAQHVFTWWNTYAPRVLAGDNQIGVNGRQGIVQLEIPLVADARQLQEALRNDDADDPADALTPGQARALERLHSTMDDYLEFRRMEYQRMLHKWILGRAMATAQPGQQLDVIIGYSC